VSELWRQLVSFDDLDSLQEIRRHATREMRKGEQAAAELRELLADDRHALIQLATLSSRSRVAHDLLAAALDARMAELTAEAIDSPSPAAE